MTKRDLFTNLLSLVDTGSCDASLGELKDGLNHELELLNKKASTPRKPTAVQMENETLKAEIVSYLTSVDMPKSIKELQAEVPSLSTLSNQRISHLLTALVDGGNGQVEKTYIKKTPYFNIK